MSSKPEFFSSDVARFQNAVEEYFYPLASEFQMKVHRVDDRAYGFSTEAIAVKIYFPLCHGWDVTVCLSPNFESHWNATGERGISWFAKFLGLPIQIPERSQPNKKIDDVVRAYAEATRQVLTHFARAEPAVWDKFYDFVVAGIEKTVALHSKQK